MAIAFLAQNCALGLTYGSYGTIVPTLQAAYGASRGTAAGGMGVMLLILGLLSPVVGHLLQRFAVRIVMIAGTLISALAYLLLGLATNMGLTIGLFGLVGMGVCLLGIIAPTTLISRSFDDDRGKALGIINMPVILCITPVMTAVILPALGLHGFFFLLAAIFVLLLPVLLLIVEKPGHCLAGNRGIVRDQTVPRLRTQVILAMPRFWLLSIGIGILTGAGSTFVTHFVAFAVSKGFSVSQGAMIFSGYGLAGIVGTYAFGWLTDRIGPVFVLALNALFQAALWSALLGVTTLPTIAAITCMVGACVTSLVALHGAAIGSLFGVSNVSGVMGLSYFIKLPFLFGLAPLTGLFYDVTGSYEAPFLAHIAAFVMVAIAFAFCSTRMAGALAPLNPDVRHAHEGR